MVEAADAVLVITSYSIHYTKLYEKDIEGGINRALSVGRAIPGVAGVVIIRGDKIGAVGDVELVGL